MNNPMARTSVREGLKLEVSVIKDWENEGWEITKNTMAMGPDGRRIKPDFIATKNGRTVVAEIKSNGPKIGSMHEKWPCGAQKLHHAAQSLGTEAVMIIRDQSGTLGSFVDAYVRPMCESLSIEVIMLEKDYV